MKKNVNIILVLTFITGACSSSYLVSEGNDDRYDTPVEKSTEDFASAEDEGKVPYDKKNAECVEGGQLAYQEYNVSPGDTIWFDDYLVVGKDTFTYEQIYPQYAYQEYGVTPSDTIWFDEFLVVGADTLEYQQVYNSGRQFSFRIYSPGPEEFHWLKRPKRSGTGMMLIGVNPVYSGLQAGDFGVLWSYSSPLMSPQKPWVEVVTGDSRDIAKPLYTYYMGLPPQVSAPEKATVLRNDRERGVLFHVSLFSAILMFLSL